MNKTETLHFKLDCEWVCNFVRQRVYYEGISFSDGIKSLKEIFNVDDNIAVSILTGHKKIVGINEGKLVDDNSTAEYLDYIARQEEKTLKETIREDVKLHPLNYIDPFATVRSISRFKELMNDRVPGQKELEDWFIIGSAKDDYVLCGGLYSVDDSFVPFLVRSEEDKERFYEFLYDYWKTRLDSCKEELNNSEYYYFPDNIKRNIELRQRKYELWIKKKVSPYDIDDLCDYYTSNASKISWVISDKNTCNCCAGEEAFYQRDAKYVPCEEGAFYKYGLISPTGDFYACEFASHNVAAGKLCQQFGYFKNRPKQSEEYITDKEEDEAKDILYDKGWVFVNTCGASTFYSKYRELEDMPQKMMDTAYDFIVWERTVKE